MSFPKPFFRWRPHPWHGLNPGRKPPVYLNAYIEITPYDTVKYELDKETGYLRVDRPQHTSSRPPMLYGLVPKTYCGQRVGALSGEDIKGDGDPLDICVISERSISHADIIMSTRVIGGLQMIDDGEADDKIIAVLENDTIWSGVEDLDSLPTIMVDRLIHYFNTYKLAPGDAPEERIKRAYDRAHAEKVIQASLEDYEDTFGG